MRKIADHPDGWCSYIKKVRELLVRDMDDDEVRDAVQAYISRVTPEEYVSKLEGDEE